MYYKTPGLSGALLSSGFCLEAKQVEEWQKNENDGGHPECIAEESCDTSHDSSDSFHRALLCSGSYPLRPVVVPVTQSYANDESCDASYKF